MTRILLRNVLVWAGCLAGLLAGCTKEAPPPPPQPTLKAEPAAAPAESARPRVRMVVPQRLLANPNGNSPLQPSRRVRLLRDMRPLFPKGLPTRVPLRTAPATSAPAPAPAQP
ncbi:MAG: hypothetical protein ACOYOB_11030 [Myxococcota bacterium]|jgi:hypothetical protein